MIDRELLALYFDLYLQGKIDESDDMILRSFIWLVMVQNILCLTSVCANASEEETTTLGKLHAKHEFNIAPMTADETIRNLLEVVDIPIVYLIKEIKEVELKGIQGEMTLVDALDVLLSESGLKYEVDDASGTVIICSQEEKQKVTESVTEGSNVDINPTKTISMSEDKKPRTVVNRIFRGLGSLFIAGSTITATAQSDVSLDEDVYELSPFEVTATDGYVATDSLAGTRMRTSINDLSQQIQVFTPEFMADIGAVTGQEALLYSTNMEGRLEYSPATGGFGVVNVDNVGRSRGLGNSVTRSKNFFPTTSPMESYNTSRTTISSGPNAILFSRGDPAGVIDVSLKQAATNRDSGSIRHRYDSELQQNRIEIDFNKAVIEDKLAIRLALLRDRAETIQTPSAENKDGIYATLTYKPFKKTTFRYHFDNLKLDIRRSNTRLTYDAATPYLDFLDANPGFAGFDNSLANLDTNGDGSVSGGEFNNAVARAGLTGIVTSSANVGQYNNRPSFAIGSNGNQNIIDSFGDFNDRRVGWTREWTEINNVDGGSFGTNPAVIGSKWESLFTSNVWGMNLREQEFTTHTLYLEQQILDDLFLELAYNHEERDEYNYLTMGGNALTLVRVDPNLYLADGVTPNPNVNKPWVGDRMRGGPANIKNETFRASLSYELDFTANEGFSRWFGRHNFAALYQKTRVREVEADIRSFVRDDVDFTTYSATATGTGNNNRAGWRFYLDPANGIHGPSIDNSRVGQSIGGAWTATTPDGRSIQIAPEVFGNLDGEGSNETSKVVVWQGFFWNDRIVPFYGRRWDDFDTLEVLGGVAANDELQGAEYNVAAEFSGQTENKGLVVHPLNWMTLSYNESELIAPASDFRSPLDNSVLPGESGVGKDYSVRFNLLDNRLSVRINYFETQSINNGVSNEVREVRAYASNIERAIRDADFWNDTVGVGGAIDPSLGALNGGFNPINDGDTPDVGGAFNTNDYNATSNIRAEGYDFEINYNITNNWVMKVTAGKQEGVISNLAARWGEYVNQRQNDWASVTDQRAGSVTFGQTGWENIDWDGLAGADEAGRVTLKDAFDLISPNDGSATAIAPNLATRLRINEALNGTSEGQVREWRVNLFTNYNFRDGFLKGASVGGGFRYRDAPIIGYQPTSIVIDDPLNPGGTSEVVINDVDKPWKGESNIYFDLKLGYKRKIFNDRYTWNVQLNIRNLFDNSDIEAAQAAQSTTYQPYVFVMEMPRQIILTNTISF